MEKIMGQRSLKKSEIKSRSAYVLFAKNSPFKNKIVKNKKSYTRKPKHKNNETTL